MQPQNGLIDESMGTSLPEVQPDETAINDLRRKAKYSRSKEYADLRAKAQERIDFYKTYLPDGRPVAGANKEELADMWRIANLMIAEFEQLFGEHENAAQLLKEEFGE